MGMGILEKLCELVAVGPGGKPESSHSGCPASDFSKFPLVNTFIPWGGGGGGGDESSE